MIKMKAKIAVLTVFIALISAFLYMSLQGIVSVLSVASVYAETSETLNGDDASGGSGDDGGTEVVPDLDASSLTIENVTLQCGFEVVNQSTGRYNFYVSFMNEKYADYYRLEGDWIFDGNMFSEGSEFSMNTDLDPEKTHKLQLKVYLVKNSDNSVVATLDMPIKYYKDGKILQNYNEPNNEQAEKNGTLRLFMLPVIALVMLLVYLLFFVKSKYVDGLEYTIDKLNKVCDLKKKADFVYKNEKLPDRKRLAKMRSLFRSMKAEMLIASGMLKSYSLEANLSVNTKLAVEKMNTIVDFLSEETSSFTTDELYDKICILSETLIVPAIAVCKQIVATNNKYLKKVSGDQY